MIINFSVQNFGSIKNKQTLSFVADKSTHLEDQYIIHTKSGLRLLKMALIYGANASGKTTVLKALDFLRRLIKDPESQKSAPLKFSPFLFDNNTPSQPTILTIEFIRNDVKYFYELEINRHAILAERLDREKANVYKRTTNLETQFSQITFGKKFPVDNSFKKILEANTLWNNTVLGGFLKTNVDIKELVEVTDWFTAGLFPLIKSDLSLETVITFLMESGAILNRDIVQTLKKADFNISDIIINESNQESNLNWSMNTLLTDFKKNLEDRIKGPNRIEFEHVVNGVSYSLPFDSESLGTQRYFGFAGLLYVLIKGRTAIPIDELESSLHPDLFNHFLLSFLMNAKSSQLIATTHNREILNNRDIFRNDAIWFTEKDEESATNLYSLSDFDTSTIRDTSNVYNAYKIGKLGGIPNLGDYYIDLNDGE